MIEQNFLMTSSSFYVSNKEATVIDIFRDLRVLWFQRYFFSKKTEGNFWDRR